MSEGKEQGHGFFIRTGISPKDIPKLRKTIIQVSMTLQTGIEYLSSLSVSELLDVIKEVSEVVNENKAVHSRGSNRR